MPEVREMRGRWPRQLWVYGVAGLFVVALGVLPGDLLAPAARTVVSLTFDNDTISQYTLGYKRALAPHGVNATFYVNSGTVGAGPNFMSWPQLRSLAAAGIEIGGKTVDGARLTGLTRRRRIAQSWGHRERIAEHGITPFAFAYPSGEFTADRKSTRLNSSHVEISYAVFCLKKKKKTNTLYTLQKKNKKKKNNT